MRRSNFIKVLILVLGFSIILITQYIRIKEVRIKTKDIAKVSVIKIIQF